MKKICIFIFACLFLANAWAQEEAQRVHINACVGLNGTTLMVPQSSINGLFKYGYGTTQKMKIGGTAGLMVDATLNDMFSLQTGVMYALQRFTQNQTSVYKDTANTQFSLATENLYKVHRMRVPVMLAYHFSRDDNHLVLSAGLYADAALSGDITYDASAVVTPDHGAVNKYVISGVLEPFKNDRKYLLYHAEQDDFTSKYKLYDGKLLNRFDVGVAAQVSYQIARFQIGVQANFGLLNMANKDYFKTNYIERNFNINILLGYKIN